MRLDRLHGAVHRLARPIGFHSRTHSFPLRSLTSTRWNQTLSGTHWVVNNPDAPGGARILCEEPPYTPKPVPNPKARNVAVIGGGITGLTTAHQITKALPNAKVTVVEAGPNAGGWLRSEIIEVDGGHVVFEWGPRTLRDDKVLAGRFTRNLMAQLNMADSIVSTSRNSAAARNRFIYYPKHLVRLPGPLPGASIFTQFARNLMPLFSEPIFSGVLRSLFAETFVHARSEGPGSPKDESVGSFMRRRFGKSVAENLVSAGLHGIYAGDMDKLSIRAIFPQAWQLERQSEGGVLSEIIDMAMRGQTLLPYEDVDLYTRIKPTVPSAERLSVEKQLDHASVFTFKRGLQEISDRLQEDLKAKDVEIQLNRTSVGMMSNMSHGYVELFTLPSEQAQSFSKSILNQERPSTDSVSKTRYDYVVSTLGPSSTGQLAMYKHVVDEDAFRKRPSLWADNQALGERTRLLDTHVHVMVVNLYYDEPSLVPVSGFGYLLPQSLAMEENPERALGVIFGSETSVGQDTAPGTKLTVMLGGRWWWNGWSREDLPSTDDGVQMARTVLERHLGITEKPAVAKAQMHINAIPQYLVGHCERMSEMHEKLIENFGGKVKVAGNSYNGVGVNDCIKSAYKVVYDIREGLDERTGIEKYADGTNELWCQVDRTARTIRMPRHPQGRRG